MATSSSSSGGIGFSGVLAIVFITLKLTGIIDWSWWLVLIPLYPAIALLGAGILALILAMILAASK